MLIRDRVMLLLGAMLLATAGVMAGGQQTRAFLLHDGDRVVFYGDSITDSEWYPTLVETYVLTHYPRWRNQMLNRGVSGDNSGSLARFVRDVVTPQADAVVYNMGFNDGGYGAITSASVEKWLANIAQSVTLARQANPAVRLALASPIPNEVSVSADQRWVSHEVYPSTMLAFGHEEESLATQLGVPFVDLGLLYGQSMGLGKVVASTSFALSRDGVHPQREGQTLIAYHLLRGLGAEALVASATLDAAKRKVLYSQRCTITDMTLHDGAFSFHRVCQSLPYPTPPEARPFTFLVHLEDTLSADLLTVRGLTAPSYTLLIDNHPIARISAAELSAGVNLSRYPDTPMYAQAMRVMEAVREKQLIEGDFWRTFITAGKADGAGQATAQATPDERAAIAAAHSAIAAAETACYALNTPTPHTISLQPSTATIARYASLVNAEINQAPLAISVAPVAVDWNQQTLLEKELTVSITNPGDVSRTGVLSWEGASGWTVTPAESPFTIAPGARQVTKFTASIANVAALMPAPTVTARWRWSPEWPYPMTVTCPVDVTPHLTINHAAITPGLTGNINDWKDATAFTLDQRCFIDPAVPGKKLLWGGPADLSGQFFFKWDETALYIAALVRDDEHLQQVNDMMMWSQDVLMTAFLMPETGQPDGRYEFGFGAYADHDHIVRYWNSARDAVGPDLRFASKLNPAQGVIFYETVIPWNRLAPFLPRAGKTFRATLVVSDADSQLGKGFNYLAWTPGIHYGKNPADFAWITLGAP